MEDPSEIIIEVEVWPMNEESGTESDDIDNREDSISTVSDSFNLTPSNNMDSDCAIEQSKERKEETKKIADMYPGNMSDSKQCCNLYRCNKLIPKEIALQHRRSFQRMSKEHQEIVIMSYLQAHRRLSLINYDEIASKKNTKTTKTSRKRNDIRYFFGDVPICKKMYLFLHDVGNDRYESICKHYDKNGIIPRVHKLKNVKPTRQSVLNEADIQFIVNFIKSYGDQFGLRIPKPKSKQQNTIKLPSNETKSSIYRKYREAIQSKDLKMVARTTFLGIWKKYCPFVTTTHVVHNSCNKEHLPQLKYWASEHTKKRNPLLNVIYIDATIIADSRSLPVTNW